MTSEDFDGRLHTHAIGIKLALGSNLQVCNPITKTAPNLHWIKLAKLAIPVSRKGPGVQTQEYPFWGVRRLIGLIYIKRKRPWCVERSRRGGERARGESAIRESTRRDRHEPRRPRVASAARPHVT